MKVTTRVTKSILTPQKTGFTAGGPYPFTHTLSAYTGCAFGKTTCGLYCYARYLPNWKHSHPGEEWGEAVQVKLNAAEALDETLRKMDSSRRSALRILMSSTTDPYQPLETKYEVTRQCLEVFSRYPDLDLLLVQTRSPLVTRDFELIRQIPYAWLSMTIETDDPEVLRRLQGGPSLSRRLESIRQAREVGIPAQVAVSPCLPYSPDFAEKLCRSGALRVVVDNCVEGDGSGGKRTAASPFARAFPEWRDPTPSHQLYKALQEKGMEVGWSAAGFCGIPPRKPLQMEFISPPIPLINFKN